MRKICFILCLISGFVLNAQELNCTIKVNAAQVSQTNLQIFQTLERSLNDFVNKTRWTDKQYKTQERINCSMVINIRQYESDQFVADNIQVSASRPVYNSTYETPVFNHQDPDFSFRYLEFEPLVYNPNNFQSNLVSVITYYIYIILGVDADTFKLNGGQAYFKEAQKILNLAQQSGFSGWNQADSGVRTRFWLIDNLLSNTFKEYHTVMYNYHRIGLDSMAEDPKGAKQKIAGAIRLFDIMNNRRPNSFLIQTFFDAKSDEVQAIFSEGPTVNVVSTVETLNRIAPFFASKWEDIKY